MAGLIKTKISKGFQTVVPAEIRARLHGEPGDEIIWSIIGTEVYIRIKKTHTEDPVLDLIGKFSTKEPEDSTKSLDDVVYGSK